MKVLQINAVYGMGSTGKMVRDISKKLVEQEHQSYVMWATGCCGEPDGTKLIRIGSTADHKIHALLCRLAGGQGMHSKGATKRACKKILEIAPDVVHLHNLHSNYIHLPTLFSFLTQHKIPVLITLHDCWFMTGYCTYYTHHNCDKWLSGCHACPAVSGRLRCSVAKDHDRKKQLYSYGGFLAVNGVSKWTTEAAGQSILGNAATIQCIYNWIDTNVFSPRDNADAIKERYGIPKERKMILGVSQFWSKEKGAGTFATIADMLADTADIVLVGENRGIAERKNLHCIGFTANIDELTEIYSAADVFVNASNAETFGLVTAEAMACGTPVVAYNNTGSAEVLADGCGILVRNGDVDALVTGVNEVLSREKTVFSSVCRQHVLERFEKNKQIQEYIDFYQKISAKDRVNVAKESGMIHETDVNK